MMSHSEIILSRNIETMNHIIGCKKYFAEVVMENSHSTSEKLELVHVFSDNEKEVKARFITWWKLNTLEWSKFPNWKINFENNNTISGADLLGYDEDMVVSKILKNSHLFNSWKDKVIINFYQKINPSI